MKVPSVIKPLINWWIDNLPIQCKEVTHGHPKVVLYSDASKLGWGGVNKTDQVKTGGQWSESEQSSHINILELKACKLTLTSLCKNIQNTHILIRRVCPPIKRQVEALGELVNPHRDR